MEILYTATETYVYVGYLILNTCASLPVSLWNSSCLNQNETETRQVVYFLLDSAPLCCQGQYKYCLYKPDE